MIYYTIIESYRISPLKFQKTFKSKKIEKREHLSFYTSVKNHHFQYLNRQLL